MSRDFTLREKYGLAGCCTPTPEDPIVGYFSFDDHIKVHRRDCPNLAKADRSRLVLLDWAEIVATESEEPGPDFDALEPADFAILQHHLDYDIDYSLKVARVLNMDKQDAFDRHHKLREAGLLERVDALIVQYRKGVVDNKWIKHRNHTYYKITARGRLYLEHRNRQG